jgi:hypothetical protein
MAANVTLSPWVHGADETVTVYNWTDAARTVALDITGRTYAMYLSTAPDVAAVLTLTGTVTGASGLVTFVATDTQTTALARGTYSYAIWETSGATTGPIQVGSVQLVEVASP